MHDNVITEFKMIRGKMVTVHDCATYLGQPTQYGVGSGSELSRRSRPRPLTQAALPGVIENYVGWLQPRLHGLNDPRYPSLVGVLIVNTNLQVPSAWSCRKIVRMPETGSNAGGRATAETAMVGTLRSDRAHRRLPMPLGDQTVPSTTPVVALPGATRSGHAPGRSPWHAAHMTADQYTPAKPRLHQAMRALAEEVLDQCRQLEPAPAFSRDPDLSRWQRQGQERFGPARPIRWESPRADGVLLRYDQFPTMDQVRQAIRDDSDLDGWMDTLVGPAHSRQRRGLLWRTLDWFFDCLVVTAHAYRLDDAAFEPLYAELEQAWLTRTVVVVDYVPLIGLESSETELALAGGYRVRRMTDDELNAALSRGAVPIQNVCTPGSVDVSRFNQWALVHEATVDLVAGHRDEHPADLGLPLPELHDAAHRLITSLRVVVGGCVQSTRAVRYFRPSILDSPGGSAVLSPFGNVDPDRPCILQRQDAAEVALVWSRLAQLETHDAAVGLAIRRLVFAGGRVDATDRLFDLMVATEALVKSAGDSGGAGSPGAKLGRLVARLPGAPQALGATSTQIEAVMTDASAARNGAIHADRSPMTAFQRLRGGTTSDLHLIVDDVDKVIRLVVRHILSSGSSPDEVRAAARMRDG